MGARPSALRRTILTQSTLNKSGDVNTQTPRISAHTRTNDREREDLAIRDSEPLPQRRRLQTAAGFLGFSAIDASPAPDRPPRSPPRSPASVCRLVCTPPRPCTRHLHTCRSASKATGCGRRGTGLRKYGGGEAKLAHAPRSKIRRAGRVGRKCSSALCVLRKHASVNHVHGSQKI